MLFLKACSGRNGDLLKNHLFDCFYYYPLRLYNKTGAYYNNRYEIYEKIILKKF